MGQVLYPKFQALDASGDPLNGGKLYTYENETSTPKTTYSDADLTTPNANPVVLDSRGEALVYGSGTFRLVLKDSDDDTIWGPIDDVTIGGVSYLFDSDSDTGINVEESTDEDKIRFKIAGTEQMLLQDGALLPTTDSDVNFGSTTKFFKDLFTDRFAMSASYYASFPTNGVAADAKFMMGLSSTIIWMYLNTAPPGWKVLATGEDTVLGVKATAKSSGTADTDTENKLVLSTATFESDGVVVGDTAYNLDDGTSALVTAVDSETSLSLASDVFPDGDEEFEVGTKFVDPGGNQADAGSWTISGITADDESSHAHDLGTSGSTVQGSAASATIGIVSGALKVITPNGGTTYPVPTQATGGGSAHNHTVSSDEKWRPAASLGRLFQLDTE